MSSLQEVYSEKTQTPTTQFNFLHFIHTQNIIQLSIFWFSHTGYMQTTK